MVGLLCLIYVTATRLSSMANISARPSVDWWSGIGSGKDPRGGGRLLFSFDFHPFQLIILFFHTHLIAHPPLFPLPLAACMQFYPFLHFSLSI